MSSESSPSGDRPLLRETDSLTGLLYLYVAEHDREALAQILECTQRPFTACARKLCISFHLPEDYDEIIYQRATIKMTQSAKQFDFARPFVPWFHAIVKRIAIDIYRNEKKHRGTRSLSLLTARKRAIEVARTLMSQPHRSATIRSPALKPMTS